MRKALVLAVVAASLVSGCGYFPVPPDPIRLVDSPSDVMACRRLGPVGPPVRTDGRGPFLFGAITQVIPPGRGAFGGPAVVSTDGDNLAQRLNVMRDAALAMGATDLLLVRRMLRDWSYVEGVAYLCRR